MSTATKDKKKKPVKPLTDAERLDYKNDLDDIEECNEAGLALGRALLDIRARKLYREDYDTWEDFVKNCPQLGISRPRSYQLMDYAEAVAEMSTIVDTTGLKEGESRFLEQIACVPDRAEVMKRIRAANLPINEKNVECFYHEYRAEKEANDKAKQELSIFEPEVEEQQAEETPAPAPKDASQEDRVVQRGEAGEFDKERMYAIRGCDHARLYCKDANKSKKEDYRPADVRQKARESIASVRRACDRVEKFLVELDAEDRKAVTA